MSVQSWEAYLASILTPQQVEGLKEALRHNCEIKISGPQLPSGKSLLCENLNRADFRAHEEFEEFQLVMDARPSLLPKEQLQFDPEVIRRWVESSPGVM